LVVVVLILGVLAGVAAPKLLSTGEDAAKQAFVQQLKVFYQAVERYSHDHGEFPANAPTAQLPVELEPYLRGLEFTRGTPLGGDWDYHARALGLVAGVGVHFLDASEQPGAETMKAIDRQIDDGDLTSGAFQRKDSGARFYWIMP
jgi:type II secretory pathway pseudopilin PulG